ncbi:MAG: methyltransferase domain-containing protein [Lactobacillales bacterium]|jgi:23S rRNA G2445 N2-methylase RlmL|nr:methyltransferase domain-containing protein [Lactobacillales bacterium]
MKNKIYIARVVQGLEEIAAREIREKLAGRILFKKWRMVLFSSDADVAQIVGLKSVNDVFLKTGHMDFADHKKEYLEAVRKAIPLFKWPDPNKAHPYFVVASIVGKHNYSRFDVERVFEEELSKLMRWRFLDHAVTKEKADFTVRVMIEDNALYAGISLCSEPLRKRAYKKHTYPGTLNPTVAYAMCQIAGIKETDSVLDPMCGMGTIPIEACLNFHPERVIGLDIEAERVACAHENALKAGVDICFKQGDATNMGDYKNSINIVISNIPWGRQIAVQDISGLYEKIMWEIHSVLVDKGRCVLLTSDVDTLIKSGVGFDVLSLHKISLSGDHPSIVVLQKC